MQYRGAVTTTGNIKVEDISYKGARKQSQILEEGVLDTEVTSVRGEPEAPKSLTPEQVKTYFMKSIQSTEDQDKRRVLAQAIHWIDELQTTKKELIKYKMKDLLDSKVEETPDDLLTDAQKEV